MLQTFARPVAFNDARFTNDELDDSIIFEEDRGLRGNAAARLIDHIQRTIYDHESRQRRIKLADANARLKSVETFVANVLTAAFNNLYPARFVAMPFATAYYVGTGLSIETLRLLRDSLGAAGLIEGANGFYRHTPYDDLFFSRTTRVRATPKFRTLLEEYGIDRQAIRTTRRNTIKLRHPAADAGSMPSAIEASGLVLQRINQRLAAAALELTEPAIDESAAIRQALSLADDAKGHNQYVGDRTAINLYRVFTERWTEGGRLYGGWWINEPGSERARITIDGQTTTELDYAQIHPTMLFAMAGLPLTFDAYTVPAFNEPKYRELGKKTFGRLVNRKPRGGTPVVLRRVSEGFEGLLPPGTSFSMYLRQLTTHLAPIAKYFGLGVGLTLQAIDSGIAIEVLDRLDRMGITALPVHDSFIVQCRHRAILRQTMIDCFKERTGIDPVIRSEKRPGSLKGGGAAGGA